MKIKKLAKILGVPEYSAEELYWDNIQPGAVLDLINSRSKEFKTKIAKITAELEEAHQEVDATREELWEVELRGIREELEAAVYEKEELADRMLKPDNLTEDAILEAFTVLFKAKAYNHLNKILDIC